MRSGLEIVKKIGLKIFAYIGGSFKYIQFKRHFNRNLISMNIYSQQQYYKFCIEKFGAKLEKNHDFYFFISGEIKEFFLLHYLLPKNTTDI
jgi:hypothetical protein